MTNHDPESLENVPTHVADFVVEFLNSFPDATQLADTAEKHGAHRVGLAEAETILERRDAFGGFADLDQLAASIDLGPDGITHLVATLGRHPSRAALAMTKSGGGSWVEEYRELIEQVIWDIFLKFVKKMVKKKFLKKGAAALAAALVDGPLPIGDIIGLLLLLWGVVDTAYGFYQLTQIYNSLIAEVDQVMGALLDAMAKEFGPDWLNNEHNKKCFEKYMADLVHAFCASTKKEKKRRKKQARNKLKACVRRR